MTRQVMLLGCTGEVGSRLTLMLVNMGFKVYGIRASRECKLKHPLHFCKGVDVLGSDLEFEIKSIRPEILIHAAWYTAPINFWESAENDRWARSSKKIIRNFKQQGGQYLIVTGSCGEYSWKSKEPLSETSSEEPDSSYGKARLELLNWIRSENIPFLWARTFFQFGMQEANGRLVPSLIDSFLVGKPYIVRKPLDVRDFVFIDDVVEILRKLILLEYNGVVNIGSGVGVKVEDIALQIADLMECRHLLSFSKISEKESIVVSNPKKLFHLLGDYSWKTLEDALRLSIHSRDKLKVHDAP